MSRLMSSPPAAVAVIAALAARLRVIRRMRRGDGGGIAVLFSILLAGGVLLGMGALTMDVGRLYAEREELQSGADAAAVAVAELCARDGGACGAAPATTAARYADTNARDGVSAVETLCGSAGGLEPCPPQPVNLTACIGDPPAGIGYVEVRTRSLLPGGSTLLPPILSGTLAGNDGYAGSQVRACARAAWGSPLRGSGLGLTVSVCEWRSATGNGTSFAPSPPAVPSSSVERVLYLHSTTAASHCPAGPSGGDSPGGFGWLDQYEGTCYTPVQADGTYGSDPGVSPSQACKTTFGNGRANRQVMLLPIFNAVNGTGTNTTYHLAGFAPFVITGYNLPGLSAASSLTGQNHCHGSDDCVYGYFTRALIPARGTIGGPDFGASIVSLVG